MNYETAILLFKSVNNMAYVNFPQKPLRIGVSRLRGAALKVLISINHFTYSLVFFSISLYISHLLSHLLSLIYVFFLLLLLAVQKSNEYTTRRVKLLGLEA
jgi:hypothetical protein